MNNMEIAKLLICECHETLDNIRKELDIILEFFERFREGDGIA